MSLIFSVLVKLKYFSKTFLTFSNYLNQTNRKDNACDEAFLLIMQTLCHAHIPLFRYSHWVQGQWWEVSGGCWHYAFGTQFLHWLNRQPRGTRKSCVCVVSGDSCNTHSLVLGWSNTVFHNKSCLITQNTHMETLMAFKNKERERE